MNIPHREEGELPAECLRARLALDEAFPGAGDPHLRDCAACALWAARVGQLEKEIRALPPVGARDRALKVLARADAQGVEWAFSIPPGGGNNQESGFFLGVGKRARGRSNAARKLSIAAGILAALMLVSVGMWLGKHQEKAYQQSLANNAAQTETLSALAENKSGEMARKELEPEAKMEAWYFVSAQLQDQVSGVFSHKVQEKESGELRQKKRGNEPKPPMAPPGLHGLGESVQSRPLDFPGGIPAPAGPMGGAILPPPAAKPDVQREAISDAPTMNLALAPKNSPVMPGKSVPGGPGPVPSSLPPGLPTHDGAGTRSAKAAGSRMESDKKKESEVIPFDTSSGKDKAQRESGQEENLAKVRGGAVRGVNNNRADEKGPVGTIGLGGTFGLTAPAPGQPAPADKNAQSKEAMGRFARGVPPKEDSPDFGSVELKTRLVRSFSDSLNGWADWVAGLGAERSRAKRPAVLLRENLARDNDPQFLKVEAQLEVVATNLKELAPKMLESALQLPEGERKGALLRLAREWEKQESAFQKLALANVEHQESLGNLVTIAKKAREDAIREAGKIA